MAYDDFEKYQNNVILSHRKYKEIPSTEPGLAEFHKHFKKYSFLNSEYVVSEPGKLFLYEKFLEYGPGDVPEQYKGKKVVSYPMIAQYTKVLPCDQTIEVEYINVERTWDNNTSFTYKDSKYYLYNKRSETEGTILWFDEVFVYGAWDKMPTWQELRPHYQKTWWFRETKRKKRNRIINTII